MYLISIIAVIGVTIGICILEGMSLTWLLDIPSLLIILLITIPILFSTGMLKDFNNAFAFVLGRKKTESLKQLKRSVEAVTLAIKTLLLSGFFTAFVQLVVILDSLSDKSKLGPMLAVSILVIVYASGLSLLLMPLRSKLKIQIVEYLSEEE